MKFKLDENLGNRGAEMLRDAGHDVATVVEQRLSASTDPDLIEVCRREQRSLVTLDQDFANPLVFNPKQYSGIVVLRLPPRPTAGHLFDAIRTLIRGLSAASLDGRLWIVQTGRIREYQPED